MKKVLIWVAVVLLFLLGVTYAGQRLYWDWTHVTVGGIEYPLDLEELDLSGQPVTYVRELPNLPYLKKLDLRHTGLSVEDCLWLRGRLPECEILWLVPFQGSYLPEDTKALTVNSLSAEDLAVLALLTELETLDGRACPDPAPLLELKKWNPNIHVLYSVALEQQRHDWDVRELTLTGSDLSQLVNAIPLLPCLETVTFSDPVKDAAMLTVLLETWPGISFTYCLELYGQTVPLDVETLDFTGVPVSSTEPLHAAMPHLPNLRHVEMVDCGVPDEEMARLNETWPDTFFAWEVAIGHFKLRNDVTYFMPYQHRYVLSDKDADQLKYLTELICLDFGHMDITRTDYLAYMPKLQYLMMCDTRITDISYCANMKDLKYVELFITDVTDFSPLLECPNLVDLNVCYTYPDDPMIFTQMKQLKNLWFRGMEDWQTITALREAMPNTRVVCGKGSSTGSGWRELPNYYAQRDIMGMWYMTD